MGRPRPALLLSLLLLATDSVIIGGLAKAKSTDGLEPNVSDPPAGTPAKEAAQQRHVCGKPRDWSAETERHASAHPSRVLTGYLSGSIWAMLELLFMTTSSWSVHTAGYPARFDLVVAGDAKAAETVSAFCNVVPEGVEPSSLRTNDSLQQCFFFPYPDRSAEHYGFFGINQAAFLLDEKIGAWLATYDLVLKSDFDIFLMPGLLDFFPPPGQVVFGRQHFVLLPETKKRVLGVASDMGLPVRTDWQHNTGMTSYGTLAQLQTVARAMIPAIKHILEKTFPQKPEGGPAVSMGEGWPLWSVYIAAMYAQEVAANTALPSFVIDPRLDAHSDLDHPSDSLLHVHCQHGAQRFSKHDFFKHHYRDLDLDSVDPLVSRDCVTKLAVGPWRAYLESTGQTHPPVIEEKDEL